MFRFLLFTIAAYGYFMPHTSAESDSFDKNLKLSAEICLNAANFTAIRENCCQSMDVDDKLIMSCMKSKHVESDEDTLKKLSRVVECMYKKKHYIKSSTELKMTKVKAQAKKLYPNNIDGQNLMVDIYTQCAKWSKELVDNMDSMPDVRQKLKGARRPFFLLVFRCVAKNAEENCPYFAWKSESDSNEHRCEDYATQCKEEYFKEDSESTTEDHSE